MNKKSLIWLTTPLNLAQEKRKFFASPKYNPVFSYCWQTENVKPKTLKRKAKLFAAILTQNIEEIVSEGQKYFCLQFGRQTLKEAGRVLKTRQIPSPKSTRELVKQFSAALELFGLDYEIKFSKRGGFAVRPRYSKRQIIINENICLEFGSIEGLVKHEMVHIVRYENTLVNKLGFRKNFLLAEEGLASYIQDYCSPDGSVSLYKHAAEYLASQIALKASLREVYNYLHELGFSPDHAWQRAARHKFGIVDTQEAGSFLKPSIYFENELKIKKLNQHEILKLFSGKIAIDATNEREKYEGKFELPKIKDYFLEA